MRRLLLLFFILLGFLPMKAQSIPADSVQLSLLTCASGTEIYSLFGHTAIRYQNFTQKKDLVFNYGLFSFKTPHFVYRFIKGETDYQLGVTSFDHFQAEYAERGSAVTQQTLNLTSVEKDRLYSMLMENYRLENRVYRYNYFYDNCTTRARDMIEKAIEGSVVYPADTTRASFRSIIHEFTKGYPWDQFGIDLCLGMGADDSICVKDRQFSPYYMMESAREAVIVRDGKETPLIISEKKVVDLPPVEVKETFFTPRFFGWTMVAISVILIHVRLLTARRFWFWDAFWFLAQGIGGLIITFLFFFSSHPHVDANWMILFFQPFTFFYYPVLIYHEIKDRPDKFYTFNFFYLTLFTFFSVLIPQDINPSILPLAVNMLISVMGRSWLNILRYH